jgi:hypothetical protein
VSSVAAPSTPGLPSSSVPPSSGASSSAVADAAPHVADGGAAPSFAAFEGPDTERRTFRHLLVGALTSPPLRLTWILHRNQDQARLQVLCQQGASGSQLGISLTGKENDESIWKPVVESNYVGRRTGESYALAAVPDAVGARGCEALPATLKLACKVEQVSVLPAGAALVPGKKRNDDTTSPARWQPGTRERVAGLRCDLTTDGDGRPLRHVRETWPLVFVNPPRTGAAPGPGVEWAYVNSDQVVQEGAYRWMPASNGERRR